MKFFISITFVLFFVKTTYAQTACLPLPNGIPAGDELPGCFLCGPIYQGSTKGYTADQSVFLPCGTIENNQWITTIADSTGTLSMRLAILDCLNNEGLEAAIYDSDLNLVSNCYTPGIGGYNITGIITATGLIPGDSYFIMIDGKSSDECDFIFTIAGATFLPELSFRFGLDTYSNSENICPGATDCYRFFSVPGADYYEWDIPIGTIIEGGNSQDTFVCLRFDSIGTGEISVKAINNCYQPVNSRTVVVGDKIAPYSSRLRVCWEEFPFEWLEIPVSEYGLYEDTVKNRYTGCKELLTMNVVPLRDPIFIDSIICPGDCLMLGDSCYSQTTNQSILLTCQEYPELKIAFADTSWIEIECFVDSFTNSLSFDWDLFGADSFDIWIDDNFHSTQRNSSFLLPINSSFGDSIKFSVQGVNFIGCPFRKSEIRCAVPKLTAIEKKIIEKVKIFPNPTSKSIEIQSPASIKKVSVFDLSGKFLFETSNSKIDLSEYDSGVYFFKIETAKGTSFRKILKM